MLWLEFFKGRRIIWTYVYPMYIVFGGNALSHGRWAVVGGWLVVTAMKKKKIKDMRGDAYRLL